MVSALVAAEQLRRRALRRQTLAVQVEPEAVAAAAQQATQQAAQVALATFRWSGSNEYICPNY